MLTEQGHTANDSNCRIALSVPSPLSCDSYLDSTQVAFSLGIAPLVFNMRTRVTVSSIWELVLKTIQYTHFYVLTSGNLHTKITERKKKFPYVPEAQKIESSNKTAHS